LTEALVTFSVYVNGKLTDRQVLGGGDDDDRTARIAAAQGELCAVVESAGGTYLVDICFADGEHVRWGTDRHGMVQPVEVAMEQLGEALERLRATRGW
jgi:hypothetical protein